MDFTRIKNLVRGNGEKLILIENGEPEAVVMSFAEYEKLAVLSHGENGHAGHPSMAVSQETFSLPSREREWHEVDEPETEFISDDQPPSEARELPRMRLDEVRLEDLPL